MGCYGIGLNRIMGTIAEVYHDDKGVIWPESVAPFHIHLINLKPENEKVSGFAEEVYVDLKKSGIEVLYDDRKETSAGEKFADSDLIGIPLRAVISEKTGEKIEIKKRNEEKIKLVSGKELIKTITNF